MFLIFKKKKFSVYLNLSVISIWSSVEMTIDFFLGGGG